VAQMWPLSNEGCNESACLIFAARLKTSRGNYAPNSGQTSNSMRRNSNGAPEVCSGEIFRRTLDVPVLTLSRALSGSGPKRDPGLRSIVPVFRRPRECESGSIYGLPCGCGVFG
jgi:hypothetical protein